MSGIDMFLPHLRGASVQCGSRVHALFLVNGGKAQAESKPKPKPAAPAAEDNGPAPHPWLVRRAPKA